MCSRPLVNLWVTIVTPTWFMNPVLGFVNWFTELHMTFLSVDGIHHGIFTALIKPVWTLTFKIWTLLHPSIFKWNAPARAADGLYPPATLARRSIALSSFGWGEETENRDLWAMCLIDVKVEVVVKGSEPSEAHVSPPEGLETDSYDPFLEHMVAIFTECWGAKREKEVKGHEVEKGGKV